MIDTKIDKRLSLVTPVLWLAMGSCDPEPGPTAPDPVQVQAMDELERAPVSLPPGGCDRMARPSVYAMFVKRYTDYYIPVNVDAVWYEHDGNTYEAQCVEGPDGCTEWIAGYELAGPITVSAEYCENVVSNTVVVESTADGCHVATQHMMIEVLTRGCLTQTKPPEPPPPPPRPTSFGRHGLARVAHEADAGAYEARPVRRTSSPPGSSSTHRTPPSSIAAMH